MAPFWKFEKNAKNGKIFIFKIDFGVTYKNDGHNPKSFLELTLPKVYKNGVKKHCRLYFIYFIAKLKIVRFLENLSKIKKKLQFSNEKAPR